VSHDASGQQGRGGPVGHGHIVLIGLSGGGKSTVGRLLAVTLGLSFYDTDALLAERAGTSVPALLRADEASFRALEEEVVADVLAAPPGVVATGGGMVLSPRNRAALSSCPACRVVWLRAPVAVLAARLSVGKGEDRPLLTGDDPVARLAALAARRDSLYRACADLIVDTDDLSPPQVARRIAGLVASD